MTAWRAGILTVSGLTATAVAMAGGGWLVFEGLLWLLHLAREAWRTGIEGQVVVLAWTHAALLVFLLCGVAFGEAHYTPPKSPDDLADAERRADALRAHIYASETSRSATDQFRSTTPPGFVT